MFTKQTRHEISELQKQCAWRWQGKVARTMTSRLNGHRKIGTVGRWDSYLTSEPGQPQPCSIELWRAVLSIPTETLLKFKIWTSPSVQRFYVKLHSGVRRNGCESESPRERHRSIRPSERWKARSQMLYLCVLYLSPWLHLEIRWVVHKASEKLILLFILESIYKFWFGIQIIMKGFCIC